MVKDLKRGDIVRFKTVTVGGWKGMGVCFHDHNEKGVAVFKLSKPLDEIELSVDSDDIATCLRKECAYVPKPTSKIAILALAVLEKHENEQQESTRN
jgi:hypothetical protein